MNKCIKHKRYKAILKPRCDCVECWRMFLDKSADYQTICCEIERRKLQGTVVAEFDPGTNEERLINNMLIEKKKEMEHNYLERKK